MLRLPASLRSRFVAFAWPYRAWARSSLPGEGSPPAWVSGLVTRCPPGIGGAEMTGSPRFLRVPNARMPRSWTPVESRRPARTRRFDAAFRCCDGVGFHIVQLSGLSHAACTLPVYASQRRLPDHHATLGSGWWPTFAGRDWIPTGTLEGFPSSLFAHLIPPSQALPGATQLLTISRMTARRGITT